MAKIDVEPADLKRIISVVNSADKEIAASVRRVQAALNAAHWNDSKRTEFQQMVADSMGVSTSYGNHAEAMRSFLVKVIRVAEQYHG